MNASAPLLELRHLDVHFKVAGQEMQILSDINFSLQPCETLGIVGESGSGKSVTIRALLGLIPRPPLARVSGAVWYGGRNLLALSDRALRSVRGREIGMVFQEPMAALNPVLNLKTQITEMIQAHQPVSARQARQRAIDILAEVGIAQPALRLRAYPHELSGGMRQRALLAVSLAANPRILLADEPTTALDVTIQAQILRLLKDLKERRQMALVFISHDLRVLAEVADRIIVLKAGRVVESGDVDDIFHAPQHPYTRQIVGLLRRGNGGVT